MATHSLPGIDKEMNLRDRGPRSRDDLGALRGTSSSDALTLVSLLLKGRMDSGTREVRRLENALASLQGAVVALEAVLGYYPRLQRVRDHVLSNLKDGVSLADAARIAAYDPTYFSRWFHGRVGITFVEWVRLSRVHLACQLMSNRDSSVAAVADATGFRSTRTFERAFKNLLGITPQAYVRVMRSVHVLHVATLPTKKRRNFTNL
jgi:AraC-like DNA-binding protein